MISKSAHAGAARGPRRNVGWFQCALGALAAAALFEIGLRPFVADSTRPGAVPVRTIRSYAEGIASAHFESDGLGPLGNRLTGNLPLPGAPEGLIVGDSHVVAYSVRDQDTMGAVAERLARASGHPLNVRQYGWPAANAPTFLAAADSLIQARKPAWVAIVLNSYNLGVNALLTVNALAIEVSPDYSFRFIEAPASREPRLPQTLYFLTGRSVLALALWRRVGLIRNRLAGQISMTDTTVAQRDPRLKEEAARVPRAIVAAFKKAYGVRLIIVYTPAAGRDVVEPIEMELAGLCAEQGVSFVSTREALERDRSEHSRLSRGFHNTAPGAGHFNAIGHQIIGEEIWRFLSAHSSFLEGR
ncbi:MAG TPA: hypothetical protein VEU11_20020 [Terriglobales bacterium]|nr:hypothetical protein [Terriglobales bacterium]